MQRIFSGERSCRGASLEKVPSFRLTSDPRPFFTQLCHFNASSKWQMATSSKGTPFLKSNMRTRCKSWSDAGTLANIQPDRHQARSMNLRCFGLLSSGKLRPGDLLVNGHRSDHLGRSRMIHTTWIFPHLFARVDNSIFLLCLHRWFLQPATELRPSRCNYTSAEWECSRPK